MKQQSDHFEIRECQGIAELESCVALQKVVWNFADADLIPLRLFVVAGKIGGQVIGAFLEQNLVGFTLSIPGTRNGHAYLHSHMLAVDEAHRNAGLGRRLKLAQREDALVRNIELIEWTFDPLEIKNAHLNIVRLGAVARRYNANQYGMSSSPLQGGLPTDRLVAEWWLRSRRVLNALDGKPAPLNPDCEIQVPAQIDQWKAASTARPQAQAVQAKNREEFLRCFARGLAVLGYERSSLGDGKFLLGHWEESFSYATPENPQP